MSDKRDFDASIPDHNDIGYFPKEITITIVLFGECDLIFRFARLNNYWRTLCHSLSRRGIWAMHLATKDQYYYIDLLLDSTRRGQSAVLRTLLQLTEPGGEQRGEQASNCVTRAAIPCIPEKRVMVDVLQIATRREDQATIDVLTEFINRKGWSGSPLLVLRIVTMPMFVAILRRLCDDYIFIVTILRTRNRRTSGGGRLSSAGQSVERRNLFGTAMSVGKIW